MMSSLMMRFVMTPARSAGVAYPYIHISTTGLVVGEHLLTEYVVGLLNIDLCVKIQLIYLFMYYILLG